MAAHMKAATATIPIVTVASDPVAFGLVPSLARPGGNLTGVAPDGGLAFYAKHLELLREATHGASRIAYLTPRAVWDSPVLLAPVKEAAARIGVLLVPAALDSPIGEAEYRRAFAAIELARADALIVGDSPENWSWSRLIIELAALGRLPAIYPDRYFAEQGGLLSFGPDWPLLNRRAGAVIAQILKGANPGDIPFYQSSRFEFIVNLWTAKALGLTIPPAFLARADEVIE
jgi:putative ABC transport system substrate-binding protein